MKQKLAGGSFAYSINGDTCVQIATHGSLDKVLDLSACRLEIFLSKYIWRSAEKLDVDN